MNTTKIVFLGAGSMSFGISMFRDLFTTHDLDGSTLCLVDTNPENLNRMTRLADLLNQHCGTGYKIEATADRRAAFQDAGFVVNSVAIDRNRLWRFDFEVPKKVWHTPYARRKWRTGWSIFHFTHNSSHPGYRARYGRNMPTGLLSQLLQP